MPPPTHLSAAAEMTPSGVPPIAVEHVDARLGPRGGDRRRDVAVADQVDAGARLAQLADQVVVALALEHDDADVGHAPALRLRDGLHVLGRRRVDVDRVDRVGPTAIFSM